MYAGADEAGKGPVLGPMVAAAVAVPDRDALPDGVADSKRLAPDRREALARTLRAEDRVRVGVAAVSPDRIDDPATDMNTLTVEAQARALRAALDGEDGEREERGGDDRGDDGRTDGDRGAFAAPTGEALVRLDAGDVDADRFARRVADRLPAPAAGADDAGAGAGTGAGAGETTTGADAATGVDDPAAGPTAPTPELDVRGEHGADDRYDVVAAASVVAKVERDRRVAAIAEEYGETYGEVGSGYPSDPATREFLASYVAEHGHLPAPARRSWSTCEDLLRAAEQSELGEFA